MRLNINNLDDFSLVLEGIPTSFFGLELIL
jgi:hypothetical protein